ncbi:MAG: hypothetical protein ACD_62C00350G0007 [uncultured bacterium]|nr:MAG: hypothetical protein ACD_62C00350G0007 [uncultured bacterium]
MTRSSPHNALNIVVLVSGRGSNLQAIIDATNNNIIRSRVTAVISNRPGVPALQRAAEANIPSTVIASYHRPTAEFHDALFRTLTSLNPDLIVLAGFMKILPQKIVRHFSGKIINIHPSLLPAFRGLNAQQQALDAGVRVTGCTVHFVDEGCDTGPIIWQDSEQIQEGDTAETLSNRLLLKEHTSLVQAIQLIENHKVILQEHETLLRRDP